MMKRQFAYIFAVALVLASWLAPLPQAQQVKHQGIVYYYMTGIDAKTAASTVIFTTDTGARFHPLFITVELTAATALTIGATVSVGTNSATYNNVLAATTSGTTLNSMLPNALSALTDSVAPGTAVRVNVSVAAIGTSGTFAICVCGYYA